MLMLQQDKTDDVKDSFYEEMECVFDKFPKYHMNILLDFNSKVRREEIFKPAIGNESFEVSNDNGVRVLTFAISKNPTVKSTIFPHCSIYIYIYMRKPTVGLAIC
jgi:hypothetical protein